MTIDLNGLQIIRLMDELDGVRQRVDATDLESRLQSLRALLKPIANAYNPANLNQSAEELKEIVVHGSAGMIQLCEFSKSILDDVLVPSGLISVIGTNSLVLAELISRHPQFLVSERDSEELRRAGADGAVFRAAFDKSRQVSDLSMRISFFSPAQAELDLRNALDSTIETMTGIEQGNTDLGGLVETDLKGLVEGVVDVAKGVGEAVKGLGGMLAGGVAGLGAGGLVVSGVQTIADGARAIGDAISSHF